MVEVQPSSRAYKACQGCRRSRTRCDRKQPCLRCQQYSVKCIRDYTRRRTKSELRQEKADLEAHNANASAVFHVLSQGKQTDSILSLLKVGTSLEDIAKSIEGHNEVIGRLPIDAPTHQGQASYKSPATSSAGNLHRDDTFPVDPSWATAAEERKLAIGIPSTQESSATFSKQTATQLNPAFPNIGPRDAEGTLRSPVHGSMRSAWADFGQDYPFSAINPAFDISDGCGVVDQSIFSTIPTASFHSSCIDGNIPEPIQESPVYNPCSNMAIDLMTLPCELVDTLAMVEWPLMGLRTP